MRTVRIKKPPTAINFQVGYYLRLPCTISNHSVIYLFATKRSDG